MNECSTEEEDGLNGKSLWWKSL